jgi:hypothetical protein
MLMIFLGITFEKKIYIRLDEPDFELAKPLIGQEYNEGNKKTRVARYMPRCEATI